MSLKFFADTHIPKQVALQLRNKGVDIVRAEEVGLAEASDEVLLDYATQTGRALISVDSDFKRFYKLLTTQGIQHNGIFSVPTDLQRRLYIGILVRQLYEYWELIEGGAGSVEADVQNQIIYIKGG